MISVYDFINMIDRYDDMQFSDTGIWDASYKIQSAFRERFQSLEKWFIDNHKHRFHVLTTNNSDVIYFSIYDVNCERDDPYFFVSLSWVSTPKHSLAVKTKYPDRHKLVADEVIPESDVSLIDPSDPVEKLFDVLTDHNPTALKRYQKRL